MENPAYNPYYKPDAPLPTDMPPPYAAIITGTPPVGTGVFYRNNFS